MIKGTRNQLANIDNKFQGNQTKVLVVCSAGLLRSPTIAAWLSSIVDENDDFIFNVRSCGSSIEYALIPVTEALVKWADRIMFVNSACYNETLYVLSAHGIATDFIEDIAEVMDIPDDFSFGDKEIIRHASKYLGLPIGE